MQRGSRGTPTQKLGPDVAYHHEQALYLQFRWLEPRYPLAFGVEYSKADLDVFGFEKTLKQCIPRSGEELVDCVGPDSFGAVLGAAVVAETEIIIVVDQ